MPIYEYACTPCGHSKEALVAHAKMRSEQPPCPKCKGPMQYAGLSTPTPGREQRFGLVLNDGSRVRGNLLKGY